MKNSIAKASLIVFLFVVIGGALNSMSASLATQGKNGNIDMNKVATAGVESVKSDLAIGQSVDIDAEDAKGFVESVTEFVNSFINNCSDNASNMIDVDAILMTSNN